MPKHGISRSMNSCRHLSFCVFMKSSPSVQTHSLLHWRTSIVLIHYSSSLPLFLHPLPLHHCLLLLLCLFPALAWHRHLSSAPRASRLNRYMSLPQLPVVRWHTISRLCAPYLVMDSSSRWRQLHVKKSSCFLCSLCHCADGCRSNCEAHRQYVPNAHELIPVSDSPTLLVKADALG